ncbi:BglG family transcription antiterminator [Paenibacillus macerans]|uniref:BglG family transcription antiterminator n=1 Tax=Paenibacillus macerans TaxID=44252 RepID=UPI002E1FF5EB|nr:BglG family transcription antiterminator [Paenibacillus macerans]
MRERKIVDLLTGSQAPVKMSELTHQLGLAERTVRELIRGLNKDGEKSGFRIRMIRGQGYRLEITDETSFKAYRLQMKKQRENNVDLNNKAARQQYLLLYLFQSDSFQSMERLADEIGVSRSTIIADLKEVEQQLEAFGLKLSRKAHYGMKIEGDEQNFRKAFSHFILNNRQTIKQSEDFQQFRRGFDAKKLKTRLLKLLKHNGLDISDVYLNNIVTHLFILLYRVSRRNLIVADQMMPRYPEPLYQKIAREVADWIAGEYAISLPQDEVEYLALHLSGKTIVQHIGDEEKAELRSGMSRILQRLDEEFLTDFNRDEELREALLMHMFPLLNRLYYNLQLKNPLVEDVYSEYANVFVISFRFAEIIEEKYGFKMSRDEAGYVALHFATHLERMKQQRLEQFRRIAVVCSSGGGSAHLIRLKLESIFPKASVITASITELDKLQDQPLDLILTTIPLEDEITKKPVIHIKQWLDDQEIQRIKETISLQIQPVHASYKLKDFKELFQRELFHLSGQDDYLELLQRRCKEVVSAGYSASDFTEQVLFREHKFTTIYKNGVAGPHPMRMSAIKDCINVTLLEKPIVYEDKPVQIIFLINLRPGQLFLHREISKLLLLIMEKEDIRDKLLHVGSYEQFITLIENLL